MLFGATFRNGPSQPHTQPYECSAVITEISNVARNSDILLIADISPALAERLVAIDDSLRLYCCYLQIDRRSRP
jgi:hypothetical protein